MKTKTEKRATKKEGVIPFKSKLAGFGRAIVSRNKAFDALDDEDKRREIAYDAATLVIADLVIAAHGVYWGSQLTLAESSLEKKARTSGMKDQGAREFQKTLLALKGHNAPECSVCQRGLMMVSTIRLGNSIVPGEDGVHDGCMETRKGFSRQSFDEMELEYESSDYGHPYDWRTKSKLLNICCNVIANGDFSIHDKTDYIVKWNLKVTEEEVIYH